MNIYSLISDQLFKWSEIYARYPVIYFAQTPRPVAAAYASFGHFIAWLAHRTLQALRQTWLQMRRWPWPWTQALSIGELSRLPATDGLRATSRSGRRRRTSGKLPSGARDYRAGLRDQPRTVTPPRVALRRPGEPAAAIAHPHHRFAIWRRAHCQHARSVAHFRVRAGFVRGGRR